MRRQHGLAVFGPSARQLPWRSPRAARQSLDPDGRAEIARFETTLGEVWSTQDPVSSFCEAFQRAASGAHIVIHPGATNGPPPWTLSDIFPGYRGVLPSNDRLPKFRSYGAYGERATDPFANRPVNLRDLAASVGHARVEQMTEELFQPIGFFHQLRTVLYDRSGRVALLAGYYRSRGAPPFGLADHARLFALQPALRRWVLLAKAIGFEPLGDGALVGAVSSMRAPAVLVHDRQTVFANDEARAMATTLGLPLADLRARGRSVRLRERGANLELVLLPSPVSPQALGGPDPRLAGLPAYLKPVVEFLREGLADKDIADRLGVPLSTARTYAHRVLTSLGVHSRRALMRRG